MLLQHLDSDKDGIVSQDDLRSLMFCDFADNSRCYSEARNFDYLNKMAQASLDEFNQISKKPMNLVLFRSVSAT